MILRLKLAENHVVDLQETFENVRRSKMRLNSAKYSFGLTLGKFLGFLISQRGIEVDPAYIKAVNEMNDPISIKEFQKLIG